MTATSSPGELETRDRAEVRAIGGSDANQRTLEGLVEPTLLGSEVARLKLQIQELKVRVQDLEARAELGAKSHEYLGDEYWDDALRGLVRAIVRDGYVSMETLRNDPAMVKFLTADDWLKKYLRQQFTEDRRDPTFVCDDPDYKLVSFTFSARYEVFCVTFKGWYGCAVRTAVNNYLSSDRKNIPSKRNRIMRKLAASNGLRIDVDVDGIEHSELLHTLKVSCDVGQGLISATRIEPAAIAAKFRRVRSGPRPGGRPRKDDASMN